MAKHPKVGIRPIIDGRERGVRESLEEQTMNMARSVEKLLTSTLKYNDGAPVECVIADGTIGRVAEAAACAEKFERAGVGLTISVTPCWCYGAETIDMNPHYPKAVWGFNGTERPGAVYLASAWPAILKKVCLLLAFTDIMYKMPPKHRYRRMFKKNYCVLPRPVLPWPKCAENPICPLVAFVWALPVLWSIPISSKNILACVTNMWIWSK